MIHITTTTTTTTTTTDLLRYTSDRTPVRRPLHDSRPLHQRDP